MANTSNNISFDVNLNRSVGFSDCVHFNLNKKTSMIDKLYLSDFISCDLDHTNAGNFTCEITKNDRNDGFLRFEIIPIFQSIEIWLPDGDSNPMVKTSALGRRRRVTQHDLEFFEFVSVVIIQS